MHAGLAPRPAASHVPARHEARRPNLPRLAARRSARTAALACLLASWIALPSSAQVQPPQPKRALLTLAINEVDKGDVMALVRPPDVLVPVATIERAGLRGFAGRRETIDGEGWVSLLSLAPDVTFVLDERALTLRLTALPRLLGLRELRLRPGAPPGMEVSRTSSVFANYGLNWTERVGFDAATEVGATFGGALALTTVSWRDGQQPVRGQTSLVLDDRARLRRLTVGDTYARASLIGFGGYLGGVRLAREYSLDPYYVQFPTGGLSGEILTPSTAEVYVNDRLVSRERLEPGQFRVADLPLVSGSNVTRVVIRDAFGRTQQISAPYYVTTTALARGLHDYDYAVGLPRRGFGVASFDYGRPVFVGQHRYGLTDAVTAGLRAELSGGLANIGPSLNLRLPQGQFEAAALGSWHGGRHGAAVAAGYSYVGRPVSLGVTARGFSDGFASLDTSALDQPRLEVNVFAGTQVFGRVGLTMQHAYADRRARGTSRRTALVGSARVAGSATVFASVSLDRDPERRDLSFTTGLSLSLGSRTSGSVNVDRRDGRVSTSVEAQRPLPIGTGFGYRARVAASGGPGGTQTGGTLQYQSPFGRYEVSQDRLGGQFGTRVAIAGGVVGIGGTAFATRPVETSYALVRVPGASGVRTYANNHEIGRTNRRGDTLVPNLLPYYGNRLGISDQDMPLDFSIGEIERTVAPPFRGGALVVFRAAEVQPVLGTVILVDGSQTVIPSFGEIRLATPDGDQVSPIGHGGEFYFENVPAGEQRAVIEYRGVTCVVPFTMPVSAQGFLRLGVLRCVVPRERRP